MYTRFHHSGETLIRQGKRGAKSYKILVTLQISIRSREFPLFSLSLSLSLFLSLSLSSSL